MSSQIVPGESYLYVAEIRGIGVKVGITEKPLRRFAQHSRDAHAYGRELGRTWVSPVPHINARENESTLKGESAREYLSRSFEECVGQAQTLPMHRAASSDFRTTPANKFLASWFPGYGEWLNKEYAR